LITLCQPCHSVITYLLSRGNVKLSIQLLQKVKLG
jgi:hypothetical protein